MGSISFKAFSSRVNGQDVRGILLSGNITLGIHVEAEQAGAFKLVAKPYDSQERLARVLHTCKEAVCSFVFCQDGWLGLKRERPKGLKMEMWMVKRVDGLMDWKRRRMCETKNSTVGG
jgi:hypothetical protein